MLFAEQPVARRDTCFACEGVATTVEHVVPAWLQKRFGLSNQHLTLPNGSAIAYRQLVIPACADCNARFGRLEAKIEADRASNSDIWKWANKIHYGLRHKDRFLAWDRKKNGLTIGDLSQDDPLQRSRLFLRCVVGNFKTEPDPFGSVFVFRFSNRHEFKFAHFVESSSICVCLGHVGYVVFAEDGQAVKRSIPAQEIISSLPATQTVEHMLWFYAQCVEMLARHTLGMNIVMCPGLFARVGQTKVHEVRPVDKKRFRATCASLGLQWIDTDEL